MNSTTASMTAAFAWLTLASGLGCVAAPHDGDEPDEAATSSVEQLVSCSGDGCNGLDPSLTPCASGSTTVATTNIYRNGTSTLIGQVELRWSASCGTNWSRVTRFDGAYAEGMYARITRAGGLSYTTFHTGYGTIWSPMVYARYVCASAYGLVDQSFTSGQATTPCY